MDSNVVFQIATSSLLFIILWVVLGRGVFRPFFAHLAEREARTVGDEKAAHASHEEIRRLQQALEQQLREARVAGVNKRESQIAIAKKIADTRLGKANEEAAKALQIARGEIQVLKAKAEKDLEPEAAKLAELVMNRAMTSDDSKTIH